MGTELALWSAMPAADNLAGESPARFATLPAAPLSSAKRLVAAVLAQALDDLDLGGTAREDSLCWVFQSGAEQPWSFPWCCEILQLNPAAVRRRLLRGWRARA